MTDQAVLAADGWQDVEQILKGLQTPMMICGGTLITLTLMVAIVKLAGRGSKSLREGFKEIGVQIVAAILLGGALMLPGVFTSLGQEAVEQGTNGGGGSQVEGQ